MNDVIVIISSISSRHNLSHLRKPTILKLPPMAKLSTHGGLRLLSNGEKTAFGYELRDPFRFNKRLLLESPIGFYRSSRGLRISKFSRGWSYGIKSIGFKSEKRLMRDGVDSEEEEEEIEFEEFGRDEFSCFRCLVLVISFRHDMIWMEVARSYG
ncbi:uncharacterized protein A4U43_C07F17320 [Asparagus officinalis]|uniref:Uncharacterized protein n=1 Tax=Asparagus officinalis TaxID=4686 RepID=A0A5P1ECN2_ASPOF|nr:uncharacterized protein A4U43_C07F17320 [Asparagus officinalis]